MHPSLPATAGHNGGWTHRPTGTPRRRSCASVGVATVAAADRVRGMPLTTLRMLRPSMAARPDDRARPRHRSGHGVGQSEPSNDAGSHRPGRSAGPTGQQTRHNPRGWHPPNPTSWMPTQGNSGGHGDRYDTTGEAEAVRRQRLSPRGNLKEPNVRTFSPVRVGG